MSVVADVLEDGEDVTNVPARRLVIRALNRTGRLEAAHGEIMRELGDIKETLQTILEMLARERGIPRE